MRSWRMQYTLIATVRRRMSHDLPRHLRHRCRGRGGRGVDRVLVLDALEGAAVIVVAGLDLSLSSTGLVVLDATTGELIDKRSVRAKGEGLNRCKWLRNFLQ